MSPIRPPRPSVDSLQDRKWKEEVSRSSIPELAADPVSPRNGDVWVRRTGAVPGATYELSFKTASEGIKRVTLA